MSHNWSMELDTLQYAESQELKLWDVTGCHIPQPNFSRLSTMLNSELEYSMLCTPMSNQDTVNPETIYKIPEKLCFIFNLNIISVLSKARLPPLT